MFDDIMAWIGIAALLLVPLLVPWWITRCDKIGIEKARRREAR